MISGDPRIGLALSGGGVRAAVFHLGVMKHLAEFNLLEQISQISTVSGGSLIAGAVFSEAAGQWPSSTQYLETIYPSLRTRLVSGDLFSFRALGVWGVFRENIRILSARSHILSRLLQRRWDIRMLLSDLPAAPIWHINTTCFETGKNWRFTRDSMGDWQFGTHYSPLIQLSDAIAASAAVPYVIGALKLPLPAHGWWQTDPATKRPIRKIEPMSRTVRLWDGGAYENLALEPLFKPMDGLKGCDLLICSDASGPLGRPTGLVPSLVAGRLASPRLFDIASDQIRALRSRMLINAIRRNEIKGFLFRMGTAPRQLGLSAEAARGYLTDEDCLSCLNYPTNLTQLTDANFDRIARHGAEVAQLTMAAYADPTKTPVDPITVANRE